MLHFLLPLALFPKLPSAEEVLQRSQKAYDALKTLEQDSEGGLGARKGTAHIVFSRPGKLRVSGTTMFGADSKYDMVSTEKATWVFNMGRWSEVATADLGIASITGISANAGTMVPSTLMHSTWGSLAASINGKRTLTSETLKGRKVFRVKGTSPFEMSVWIDPVNYLIVQTEMTTMGQTIKVTYSPPKVNLPIPASRFKK